VHCHDDLYFGIHPLAIELMAGFGIEDALSDALGKIFERR
jgi:hypothetical protein